MTKVVNLRQFRKRKARQAAELVAAENRLRHGRTPAERRRDETLEAEARRRLDGLRRDPATPAAEQRDADDVGDSTPPG